MPIPLLPSDFFTRYDWDSQDLDKLGNATRLIQECAEGVKQLGEDVNQISGALTQEVQDRKDADSALDNTLTGLIDAEEKAREAADSALEAKLTSAITAEATRAGKAEADLKSALDAEAQARTDADDALQASIDAEATRAKDAEATLQANGDAEAVRAKGEESALSDAIAAERTARAEADATLTQDVSALDSAYKAADSALDSKLTQAVDAEATARQDADAALRGRMDKLEETQIWHGRYTFASVPANATQTYSFQLDVTYDAAEDVAVYVSADKPYAYPYVVTVTPSAFAVGILNMSDSDMTDVTVYAQTVGKVTRK